MGRELTHIGRVTREIERHAAASLDTLVELAGTNSGTLNAEGVAAVAALAEQAFSGLAAEAERCTLPAWQRIDDRGDAESLPLGPLLRLRRPRPGRPSVLLVGHTDTVFGRDHPFQQVRQHGERLCGPGVADLKGGLVVMRDALRVLEASPVAAGLGWEVILNPDEEIGSPASAGILAEAAGQHDLGLIFEPAMPDGALAGGRRGSGNWTVVVHGRGAHAGREPERGRNAVVRGARLIQEVDALNGQRPGVTLNPAYMHGGGPTNQVPDQAVVRLNARVATEADADWVRTRLEQIRATLHAPPDYQVVFHGGFSRPPKPLDAAHETLFAALQRCGEALGEPVCWRDTGGCCDGNNLAAAGLVNVDTLGVVGGGIHTEDEYMEIPSLTRRAQLAGALLLGLASGELALPGGEGNASG